MKHSVKIVSITFITHDVLQIRTEKPVNFLFKPGQATDVAINKNGWEEELRAFTFTSTPSDPFLEFTIKTYPARLGVTNQLIELKSGDKLILHDVFGDIEYKGEGLFIAGGAGITPFLSILKQLDSEKEVGGNKLIFANKTKSDIIHEKELNTMLGNNFINILSKEKIFPYQSGYISKQDIKEHYLTNKYIYLCGPPEMMESIEKLLTQLNINENLIVKEAF